MSDMKDQAKSLETSMFLQNLVKLIPVEIMALFAVVNGLIPTTADPIAIWIVLGILTVLVPFYTIFAMKVKKWTQIVLTTIAFPIWIVAMGGLPVTMALGWYEPWMMSVGLALYTLIPPMIYGYRVPVEEVEDKAKVTEPTTAAGVIEAKSWREV